jgi:hypothetical protein
MHELRRPRGSRLDRWAPCALALATVVAWSAVTRAQDTLGWAPGAPDSPSKLLEPLGPVASPNQLLAPTAPQQAPANAQSPPPKITTADPQTTVGESPSRISDEVIGLQPIPERPRLLVETNDHFLSTGFLTPGIDLPTGAVWRPSLWVFGDNRVAAQYFNNNSTTDRAEIVDRLDLFTQLNLTGTERFVYEARPLDREVQNVRKYTSFDMSDGQAISGVNIQPQALFFEGDFGEIFPNLDLWDTRAIDYGFSVGRQPVIVQEGLLINADRLDALTITRNTLHGNGILNMRSTFMFAWNLIHRNENVDDYIQDNHAKLYGFFNEIDLKVSTVNADFVYVDSSAPTGSGFYFGLSSTQRIPLPVNTLNNTIHVLGSFAAGEETLATGHGVLVFNQLSMTPHGSDNIVYLTTFGAMGSYVSAARGVEQGGPLTPEGGLLFDRPAIGVFGTPINPLTSNAVGAAIGYQIFLEEIRKQLILEVGGKQDTDGSNTSAIGVDIRYVQALGHHCTLTVETAVVKPEGPNVNSGARIELLTKF